MKKPQQWITLRVRVEDRDALLKFREEFQDELLSRTLSKLPKSAQKLFRKGAFSQGHVFGIAVAMARAEIATKRKSR